FINGSHPCPPATITTDEVASPNPKYKIWVRQNKLFFGALVGSLTVTIIPLITRATTSHQAWITLAYTYAKPTRGHIKQIKDQLKTATKGSQTISDYMQFIKDR
ncbi:hypothetical protein Ddye_001616, partial [Dipteronia dyeriana]